MGGLRHGAHEENFQQLVNSIREESATAASERSTVDFGEPYVGVQAFTEQHALFFAGRNTALEDLRQWVRISPFIALTGPAGSGKSSLVRASLFPALRQEKEVAWETLAMRPGEDAIASAAALAESINEKAAAAAILAVESSVSETATVILDALGRRNPSAHWLLFVDSAEELFAPGRDPKRSTLFVQLLVALARDAAGRLCVLAACRDDALSAIETAHPFFGRPRPEQSSRAEADDHRGRQPAPGDARTHRG